MSNEVGLKSSGWWGMGRPASSRWCERSWVSFAACWMFAASVRVAGEAGSRVLRGAVVRRKVMMEGKESWGSAVRSREAKEGVK